VRERTKGGEERRGEERRGTRSVWVRKRTEREKCGYIGRCTNVWASTS
jgi:hypothetical protein